MAIIAGIDEAGLGPVLGPLVVSTTAFRVPDELADVSMWKLLAGAVSRSASRKRGSLIAFGDSKKLYNGLRGNLGLEHLERGVLSALASRDDRPESLMHLLEVIAPGAWPAAQKYPWYAGADSPLPRSIGSGNIAIWANSLKTRMAKVDVALLTMRSEVVFEGEFNRLIEASNNKSSTLFDVTCRLLMHLWRGFPAKSIRIFVDHQGGRVRYLPGLQRVFEGCSFKVLEENDTVSAYRLEDAAHRAEICFAVECEDRQMPVALASMVSKYVRELLMDLINRFWAAQVPDLAPTSGYYCDGNRFFAQIQPAIRRLGLDQSLVYRSR